VRKKKNLLVKYLGENLAYHNNNSSNNNNSKNNNNRISKIIKKICKLLFNLNNLMDAGLQIKIF